MTSDDPPAKKTVVQPTAAWPNVDGGIASGELAALWMPCGGAPYCRIGLRTGLSLPQARRLAKAITEEANSPPQRLNVLLDGSGLPSTREACGEHRGPAMPRARWSPADGGYIPDRTGRATLLARPVNLTSG
ncbi:hypothetical protein [Streptomyces kanamyceticus]|uniref:hypothetical protein n=1 Tax=Streptomyces kanamyceticus TaxID=1967 RepID=UPI000B077BBE|nr:hypothetical protein [Streptomyces kanamyceticus]